MYSYRKYRKKKRRYFNVKISYLTLQFFFFINYVFIGERMHYIIKCKKVKMIKIKNAKKVKRSQKKSSQGKNTVGQHIR